MGWQTRSTRGQRRRTRGQGLAVADTSDEFYGGAGMDGMADSIDAGPEEEDEGGDDRPQKRQSFTAPRHLLDVPQQQDEEDPMLARSKSDRIADREDEYHSRRQGRVLSPSRSDAFALGDKTPDVSQRSYKDVMAEQRNAREREELKKKLKEQDEQDAESGEPKKRRRWDQPTGQTAAEEAAKKAKTRWDDVATPAPSGSKWDATPTPGRDPVAGGSRWDATPTPGRAPDQSKWDATPTPGRVGGGGTATPSRWDAAPTPGRGADGNRWDATPTPGRVADPNATPSRKNRWDETPTPGRNVGK